MQYGEGEGFGGEGRREGKYGEERRRERGEEKERGNVRGMAWQGSWKSEIDKSPTSWPHNAIPAAVVNASL